MSKRSAAGSPKAGSAKKAAKAPRHAVDHGEENVKGIDHPEGMSFMTSQLISINIVILSDSCFVILLCRFTACAVGIDILHLYVTRASHLFCSNADEDLDGG